MIYQLAVHIYKYVSLIKNLQNYVCKNDWKSN